MLVVTKNEVQNEQKNKATVDINSNTDNIKKQQRPVAISYAILLRWTFSRGLGANLGPWPNSTT